MPCPPGFLPRRAPPYPGPMNASYGQPAYRSVQDRMRPGEKVTHAVLIMFTCGCWYPVYRARKHRIERVTTVYKSGHP